MNEDEEVTNPTEEEIEFLDKAGAVQLVREIKSEVMNIAASMAKTFEARIGAVWMNDAAPFSQIVNVPGMLASDTPIIDVVPAQGSGDSFTLARKQLDAWCEVYKINSANDALIVYSRSKTTTEIPIKIVCVRPVTV